MIVHFIWLYLLNQCFSVYHSVAVITQVMHWLFAINQYILIQIALVVFHLHPNSTSVNFKFPKVKIEIGLEFTSFYFLSYFYFSNKCELCETKIKFSFHDFYTFILEFFFHLDERLYYKIKYSHQKQILQQLCGTYIPCWALIICVCSISDMHVWLVYLHCTSFYYCKME